MDLTDPRLDPEAYITDDVELYWIIAHESIGQRLYVENCHGEMKQDSLVYSYARSWVSDSEVTADFRLAQASPARQKLLETV